jgi:hypothetical protein
LYWYLGLAQVLQSFSASAIFNRIFNMSGSAPIESMIFERATTYESGLDAQKRPVKGSKWHAKEGLPPKDYKFLTSPTFIKHIISGIGAHTKTAQVCAFFVDPEKIAAKKVSAAAAAAAAFAADSTKPPSTGDGPSFVSTNDVVTSHFLNASQPRPIKLRAAAVSEEVP